MDYQLDEHYEVSKDIMGTKIKHPAFGTFRINRSSCGEHPLFGSSITHRDVMTLTVSHASEHRDLHNDWIHAERPIVEFEMSYSQFMEAICNQTSGTGIPCTINYTEKDGRTPKCKFIDKKQEFQDEFQAKIDEVNAVANTLYAEVKELFDNKKNISKTDRIETNRMNYCYNSLKILRISPFFQTHRTKMSWNCCSLCYKECYILHQTNRICPKVQNEIM